MMEVEMLEVYVLCGRRTKKLAFDFLDEFLPERKGVTDEYPYPEYSEKPEHVYINSGDLITVLEKSMTDSYSLYWDCVGGGDIKSAMLFFTEDGAMIAGVVVPEDAVKSTLTKLSSIVGGDYGFVNFDSPPPETCDEFIACCNNSDQIKLISGSVVSG